MLCAAPMPSRDVYWQNVVALDALAVEKHRQEVRDGKRCPCEGHSLPCHFVGGSYEHLCPSGVCICK